MKIHVIVNPNAGKRIIQRNLEQIIGKLILDGTAESIRVTRTEKTKDATQAAAACTAADTDLIIGCGGDGTINEIVNGIMESGEDIPLAILAAGTSNDFASSLRLPDEPEEFCQMVRDAHYRRIDLGLANNGTYFVNVAAFGMFTNVAHTTNRNAKNTLGRLAYYLQAAASVREQLVQVMPLEIEVDGEKLTGNFHLCLVVNSKSVATFRKLMEKADVSDGVFDILLMKKLNIFSSAAEISNRILSGDFYKLPSIQYLQGKAITFQSPKNEDIEVDVDGECFGTLPLTISVCHEAIRLMVPEASLTL